jgi:hypothetical protein
MCVGEKVHTYYMLLEGTSEGKTLLLRLGKGGRVILDWIFKIRDDRVWTRLMWLRVGTNVVLFWRIS